MVGIHPTKVLVFPEARQSTNFSCGAASVQAVLYYYGIDLREDKLIAAFKAKPTDTVHSGIDPDVLKDKLEKIWGLKVEMRQMTLDDLRNFVDQDIPVIIAMQAWRGEDRAVETTNYAKDYKDGHYVVVIGYSDQYIIFEDPSILTNRGYLSMEDLEERWHDADYHGNHYDHLGLAISGKKPVFNPEVFKKIL